MKKLKKQDKSVVVVGVSGDSVESQKLFKKIHKLNFTLLADEDGAVAKAFGVPVGEGGTIKKEIDGKEYTLTRGVTPKRWTWVINKKGTIILKNTDVKTADDSKTVLKAIKKAK